ncbi:hypothetical protein [Candidatus Enterovibrio escicola]|uniref:hypothetical protein n=1 Tax=Candidatus Enterovibrio escicola TaxID=1927127 RepID=UPI00123839B8|nr:hypothetical protein [Candidatus Enterovibrio escacola]
MSLISKEQMRSAVQYISGSIVLKEIHADPYGVAFETDNGRLYRITSAMSEAIYASRLIGYKNDHLPQIHSISELEHDSGKLFCIEQNLWQCDGHNTVKRALQFLEMNGLLIEEYEDIDSIDEEDKETFLLEPRYEQAILALQEAAEVHRALGNYTTELDPSHVATLMDNDGRPQPVLINQMSVDLEAKLTMLPHFTLGDFVESHPSIRKFNDPSIFISMSETDLLVEEELHSLLAESINSERWQLDVQPYPVNMVKK